MLTLIFRFTRGMAVIMTGLIWTITTFGVKGETNIFERGCAAYEAREFAQAAKLFAVEIKQSPSAEAWHNFGNAEWECRHSGTAILAWERALWISPLDKAASASLRYARRSGQLAEPSLRWWETFSTWLPVDAWACVGAVSFWLAVTLAFVLPVLFGLRGSSWTQSFAAIGFGIFLLAIPGMVGIHTRTSLGVVLKPGTPLCQTPTSHAQVLTRIPAGEVGRCQFARGDYLFLCLSTGDSGWVKKDQIQWIADR